MMTPRPERDWSGKLQAGATREAVSLVEMVLSIDQPKQVEPSFWLQLAVVTSSLWLALLLRASRIVFKTSLKVVKDSTLSTWAHVIMFSRVSTMRITSARQLSACLMSDVLLPARKQLAPLYQRLFELSQQRRRNNKTQMTFAMYIDIRIVLQLFSSNSAASMRKGAGKLLRAC